MSTRSIPALLAGDAPRSEHDPEVEAEAAATSSIAMHPVTGAFADPTHELAFAAQFFRLSFRGHVLLIALPIAVLIVTALSVSPDILPYKGMFATRASMYGILALVGRVLVHRMHDAVHGQRVGSWTWTALAVVPMSIAVSRYATTPTVACETSAKPTTNLLWDLVFALVNGSHGMGFAHKLWLIGALLLVNLSAVGACGVALRPRAGLASAVVVVGFVVAHLAEMQLRQTYAEKVQDKQRQEEETTASRRLEERVEQLRAEKERLLYDVRHRGRPLDDGDDRSAIRRGLQAGCNQPYHRAESTGSSETRAPDSSDSPPPSLPPGPPSSSDRKSSESGKSGQCTGNSSQAVHGKSTAPPPTWAELDARFYAERAAESAAEQRLAPGALSSTAEATSSSTGAATALPPPSWAELAYRRFYAERAARSTTAEQGKRPPMDQPPTWAELEALHHAGLAARSATEQGVELESSEQELAAAQALAEIARRPPSYR